MASVVLLQCTFILLWRFRLRLLSSSTVSSFLIQINCQTVMLSNYTIVKWYRYCQTLHCQTLHCQMGLLSNGSEPFMVAESGLQSSLLARIDTSSERRKMMSPEEFTKWFMKNEADHKEYMEWKKREREADHQKHLQEMELEKKCEAEHLKRMDEIKYRPAIPHPIISCSIPSPLVQEVSSLQVHWKMHLARI